MVTHRGVEAGSKLPPGRLAVQNRTNAGGLLLPAVTRASHLASPFAGEATRASEKTPGGQESLAGGQNGWLKMLAEIWCSVWYKDNRPVLGFALAAGRIVVSRLRA